MWDYAYQHRLALGPGSNAFPLWCSRIRSADANSGPRFPTHVAYASQAPAGLPTINAGGPWSEMDMATCSISTRTACRSKRSRIICAARSRRYRRRDANNL